jgi:hypothetical protein
VPEGLSTTEVVKEIGGHARHHAAEHHNVISIVEAVILSVVAITAAWSGFSAAKWGTESSLELAKASATRAKANRAFQQAITLRVGDSTTFNAWFGAYLSGNKRGAAVAERRFRPEYRVAFNAWMATHPFTNPHAPPGPGYMPQYKPAGEAQSAALDKAADERYAEGQHAAETADNYVRTTVILASVLFLVGIGSHFPIRGVRIALIVVGFVLLTIAAGEIFSLPRPP